MGDFEGPVGFPWAGPQAETEHEMAKYSGIGRISRSGLDRFGLGVNDKRCHNSYINPMGSNRICAKPPGHVGEHESILDGSKWVGGVNDADTHVNVEVVPEPDQDHMLAKSIAAAAVYRPHKYQGMDGLIGGNCHICGGPSTSQVHSGVDYHNEMRHWTDTPSAAEVLMRPAVYMEIVGKHVTLEFQNLPSIDAIQIVAKLLPDIMERFLRKNKDYGDDILKLGPKAEFVRIWNKVRKLKKSLWDGETLDYEQDVEIIDDLIGHLLLARLGLTTQPTTKSD